MHVPQRLVPNRQATHRRTPWPRTVAIAIALVAAALLGSALAQAANAIVQVRSDAKLGSFLTDANGMTLYTFTHDTAGTSNCNGGCAQAWPPLKAESASAVPHDVPGSFSVITRQDGSKQLAYDGMPLYTWKGDKKPGDATGQGFRGTWWVANLEPAVHVLKTASGDLLVGPTGKTLYTFAKDTATASACTGTCATNWPPLVGGYDPAHGHAPTAGKGVSGTLGTLTRADGAVQVTWNGKPLYYFRGDTAPGQTNGNGLLGEWQTVSQP